MIEKKTIMCKIAQVFTGTICGYGGIGRRSALRMLWRNPWGFKSPYPHHFLYIFMYFLLARKIIILLGYTHTGMKGLKLLFGVCLGMLAFYGTHAVDMDDVARAASRATAQKTSSGVQSRTAPSSSNTKSSSTGTTQRTITSPVSRDRATTTGVDNSQTKNVTSRTGANAPRTATQNISTRSTIAPRAVITTGTGNARRATTNSTVKPRSANTPTRTTTTSRNRSSRNTRRISRAATNESGALVANYSGCRNVYYECMDEFCATKDTNLRRCACSSRVNEFNSIKKQMSKVEDKMLDFNQKLLMVNMDAEDVDAITNATEGEDAFYATKDKTKSKRALDDIAKKLNATFGDSDSGSSLAPITMSLNIDSAFDTVDSFMGVDTTTKTGPALYNAAIPVCRDIATEVCTEDELSLAISGYQMLMEQDCNTVFKSYQSKADAARAKVFESSALLDMSRLEAYQTRNSDDMLTCKSKMLEMLSDSTVCGKNLQNCLDMTGKYIDPTTGKAFLTADLSNLDLLLTRPSVNQTWTSANSSSSFLAYLKNKKTYLAAAMENCQDIADSVWDAFIEDALSQIKLAQTAKLEEIRQACTTLTAECLTSTAETISGFDARALSIFGVAADRMVNSVCADIQTACTTLIDTDSSSTESWNTGITDIATNKTYETILTSCTQVGRNCIIQACKSISGNFDLCDDIEFSANRHAILERTSCWPELKECVGAAGDEALVRIVTLLGKSDSGENKYAFYDEMYDRYQEHIYSICYNECGEESTDAECAKCRIAERIWGNCEYPPQNAGDNRILIPTLASSTSTVPAQSTLLAWFAINTGTATQQNDGTYVPNQRSCVNTRCASGVYIPGAMGTSICMTDADYSNDITNDGMYCPNNDGIKMQVRSGLTNCCYKSNNVWGHIPMDDNDGPCCETGNVKSISVPDGTLNMCVPRNTTNTAAMKNGDNYLVCVGGTVGPGTGTDGNYPAGTDIQCTGGRFILVTADSKYSAPINPNFVDSNTPRNVYYNADDSHHAYPQLITSPNGTNYYIHYEN